MFFAISANVHTLSVSFDGCTKRVIRVSFRFLQDFHLGCTGRFVGVEHDINTIREIIRIDCHAFQIMVSIHQNTNLRIVAFAEIQIRNATTNFHYAVFVQTALVTITNSNAA